VFRASFWLNDSMTLCCSRQQLKTATNNAKSLLLLNVSSTLSLTTLTLYFFFFFQAEDGIRDGDDHRARRCAAHAGDDARPDQCCTRDRLRDRGRDRSLAAMPRRNRTAGGE